MEGLPLTRGWDDCSCKCHDSLFLSEQALQNAMIMDDTVPLGNFDHPNNNLCWKIIDSYILVSPFPHFFSPESPAIFTTFPGLNWWLAEQRHVECPCPTSETSRCTAGGWRSRTKPLTSHQILLLVLESPQNNDLKCNSRVIFMTKRLYLGCSRSEWLGQG